MDKSMFRPIHSQPISNHQLRSVTSKPTSTDSFSQHLQEALQPEKLTLSKHAKERMSQRGIQIDEAKWGQIQEKVNEAKKMGVKDSLVLLQDAALIISAKNNTVITAMDRQEATAQIFTNINGTIILE